MDANSAETGDQEITSAMKAYAQRILDLYVKSLDSGCGKVRPCASGSQCKGDHGRTTEWVYALGDLEEEDQQSFSSLARSSTSIDDLEQLRWLQGQVVELAGQRKQLNSEIDVLRKKIMQGQSPARLELS